VPGFRTATLPKHNCRSLQEQHRGSGGSLRECMPHILLQHPQHSCMAVIATIVARSVVLLC
jgi:hypothetical protein